MGSKFFSLAAMVLEKLPIEKMLVPARDRSCDMDRLKEILTKPQPQQTARLIREQVREKTVLRQHAGGSTVTNAETVDYQNLEIGKLLLQMERHARQKFRINGKVCECGASKHLLDLESLAEETIPMVDDPAIYYAIIEWVREIGPKCTVDAVRTGQFDREYPVISGQARDLRKDILGTLDVAAMWPKTPKVVVERPGTGIVGTAPSQSGNDDFVEEPDGSDSLAYSE